jgi:tetratricopeptide (TPR) repeat protein
VVILNGCFGWFFTQRGEYDLAIEYCNRALSLVEGNSSNDNKTIEIAMIHNTMGWSYYEKENYDSALFWCQKAAEIFKHCSYAEDSKYVRVLRSEQKLKKSPSRNDVEYAEILTNIGCIYFKKNDFDKAISYCKISINTLERSDHETIFERDNTPLVASSYEVDNHHETIAANHEVFADIYYSKENYFLALEYYQKARDIFLKITPKIPICLQRSPSIFGRNLKRLQNSIRITEQNLIANKKRTSEPAR